MVATDESRRRVANGAALADGLVRGDGGNKGPDRSRDAATTPGGLRGGVPADLLDEQSGRPQLRGDRRSTGDPPLDRAPHGNAVPEETDPVAQEWADEWELELRRRFEHAAANKWPPFGSEYQVRQNLQAYASAIGTAPGLDADRRERLVSLFLADERGPAGPYRNPGPVRTALYRHFDADGVLLYVGIADRPTSRTRNHARDSEWAIFAATADMEWFPDRGTALEAERDAIRAEMPIFNWVHNDSGRRDRVKDYLVSKKAWQFLEATI